MFFTLMVYLTVAEKGKLIARKIETEEVFETRQEAKAKRDEILKNGYKDYTADEIRNVLINPKGEGS